jgi:hypothetical protein
VRDAAWKHRTVDGAFSRASEEELRAAGWYPGRQVDPVPLLAGLDISRLFVHPAALKFLAEYGGLALTPDGPGVSLARQHFTLDPALCAGEEDRFIEWGQQLGRALLPIGDLDHGRFFLGIDEDSKVYLVETWVASFGPMPLALENLLSGVRPDPVT